MTSLLSTGLPPEKPRARRDVTERAAGRRAVARPQPEPSPQRLRRLPGHGSDPDGTAPRTAGTRRARIPPEDPSRPKNISRARRIHFSRMLNQSGNLHTCARARPFSSGWRNLREIVSPSGNNLGGRTGPRARRGRERRGYLPASGGVAVDGGESSPVRASSAHERASRGRRARVFADGSGRFHRHPRKSERKPPASVDPRGGRRARRPRRGARERANRGLETRRTPTEQVRHPARRSLRGFDRSRSASRASDGARPGPTSSGTIRRVRGNGVRTRRAPRRAASSRRRRVAPRLATRLAGRVEDRPARSYRRVGPRGGRRAVVPDPNATHWLGATCRRSGSTLALAFPGDGPMGAARVSPRRGDALWSHAPRRRARDASAIPRRPVATPRSIPSARADPRRRSRPAPRRRSAGAELSPPLAFAHCHRPADIR